MSQYVRNIGSSIVTALASVPSAQPAQVAGYWANSDFWLSELQHLMDVNNGYESRLDRMKAAHDAFMGSDRPPNRDINGTPRQTVVPTSRSSERKNVVGAARASIQALADRALDLRIIDKPSYFAFLDQLREVR